MEAGDSSRCPFFESSYCRSCALLSISRAEELARKETLVATQILPALSGNPRVFPIWGPESILPSRSKAKLQVSGTSSNPIVGLLTFDGRRTEAKELLECPLHLSPMNELLLALARDFIPRFRLEPYDPASRSGELKGIILIANEDASQMILRFVCRSRLLEKSIRMAVPDLLSRFSGLKVVSLNIQPIPHAILEGTEEFLLTSCDSIEEKFTGFSLNITPRSFKQVTHETADALYTRARERASSEVVENLLDLYCGTGAFSLALAPSVKHGLGVEISEEAVRSATKQTVRFPHLRFEAADLERDFQRFLNPCPDLLVLNPPRRGLSPALVTAICDSRPRRVFYSSCNPKTLLRDLLSFESQYIVTELHPFDMFPQTEHLEILSVLTKKTAA